MFVNTRISIETTSPKPNHVLASKQAKFELNFHSTLSHDIAVKESTANSIDGLFAINLGRYP